MAALKYEKRALEMACRPSSEQIINKNRHFRFPRPRGGAPRGRSGREGVRGRGRREEGERVRERGESGKGREGRGTRRRECGEREREVRRGGDEVAVGMSGYALFESH